MLSCRPLPGPGLGDGGQRCGRAGSEAACELSLAAAYIEHPGEALGDEAPGDQLVNVPCHRVAAKHRAREAHAAGEEEYMAEGSYTRLQKVINVPKLHAL